MDQLCRDTLVCSPPGYHETRYSPVERLRAARGAGQIDVNLAQISEDEAQSPTPFRACSPPTTSDIEPDAQAEVPKEHSDFDFTDDYTIPPFEADFTIPPPRAPSWGGEVARSNSTSSQPTTAPPAVTKVPKQTAYVKPNQFKRKASAEGVPTSNNKKKAQLDAMTEGFTISNWMEQQRDLLELRSELRARERREEREEKARERERLAEERREKREFKLAMKRLELEMIMAKQKSNPDEK